MIIFFPFSLTATPLKNFGGTYDAIRYLPPTRVPKAPHPVDTVSTLKNISTMSALEGGADGTSLGTTTTSSLTTDRHHLSPKEVPTVPHQDKLYTKIRLKFIRQLIRHSKQSIATQVFDQSLDFL
eukprot:COSAG01_NODE_8_length_44037_cov_102.614593_18_plen_125_part_00